MKTLLRPTADAIFVTTEIVSLKSEFLLQVLVKFNVDN